MTPDEVREIRNAFILAACVSAAAILFAWLCDSCKADYVIAFHGPGCLPCAHMVPVEDALRAEHYDIRTVDASQRKDLASFYNINRWPQYAYVIERGGKPYDSGARLLGEKTPGQLRRFCVIPAATAVGAAARSGVAALFSPLPCLEW